MISSCQASCFSENKENVVPVSTSDENQSCLTQKEKMKEEDESKYPRFVHISCLKYKTSNKFKLIEKLNLYIFCMRWFFVK